MTQLELWDDSRPKIREKPGLTLFVNDDDENIAVHRLARCIYAETGAKSLAAVEALCVMARNTGRKIADLAADENVFESLRGDSPRHKSLLVDSQSPGFQMCLRAVKNMGALSDTINGAVRFHHADVLPEWATALGSVAEVEGMLFYK